MKSLMFIQKLKKNTTSLKQIKESDFGYYQAGSVAINVEKIWNEKKESSKFIKLFSKIIFHETLHYCIEDNILEEHIVGEEKIIRKICK